MRQGRDQVHVLQGRDHVHQGRNKGASVCAKGETMCAKGETICAKDAAKVRACAPEARLPLYGRRRGRRPWYSCIGSGWLWPALVAGPGPWPPALGRISKLLKITQIYPKFSVFGAAIGPRREISRLNGRIASTSEGLVPRPLSAIFDKT